eukprot:GFUD01011748.1.p1 GENE.GFUD01011748.1~~GFUD01011748.1.p1  ORF type:complete len:148 (+),score=30.97 GFUD01011748.1:34-477(+)
MDVDREVFGAFAFYAAIVTGKMVIMSLLTARQRFKTMTFIASEDTDDPVIKKLGAKVGVHEDVERVRRAHQNDLENIIPFLILGLIYIFTNPAFATALFVFRLFVGARILHTIVYLMIIPQPARALTFFVGVGVNLFMACKIVVAFM